MKDRLQAISKLLVADAFFANLDPTRCVELHVDKGRLFGLKAYSKSLKRFIKVAIWYPEEDSIF